jgi:hypothetical protein
MTRLIFLILLLSQAFCSLSQSDSLDRIDDDTIQVHSVRKAIIYSAVLPGSGQIYNHLAMPKGQKKAFWKVPLIYAGLGATTYFLISNQLTQKALKQEYTNRINGNQTDPQWEAYDNDGVLTLYNQYLNNRDLSILGLAAVYALQVADAGIEAHFVRFDITKDLSMIFRPSVMYNGTPGVKASFNFR